MLNFNHLVSGFSPSSRARSESRPRRRNVAQIGVQSLEDRELKSNIPGVSAQFGTVYISGTRDAQNSASVSYEGDQIKVTLNDQVVRYNASDVYSISYVGGSQGSDTFKNDTNLSSLIYGYGGGNNFSGSASSFNLVYMHGDNNNFDARGGTSYVFSYDGPNSRISNYYNVYTYSYSTAGFTW